MQLIGDRETMRKKNRTVTTGLCVECAIRHHDYKEILPHGRSDDHFPEAPLPSAWIDGRRHRLLIPASKEGTSCSECNKRVPGIFLPID